jgi:hypothetical protein
MGAAGIECFNDDRWEGMEVSGVNQAGLEWEG